MTEPGHNSRNSLEGLTDDQQRALLFQHLGPIAEKKEDMASLNGELRNLYKKAKADGFSKKEIDFALALISKDQDEMSDEHKQRMRIARWVNHPIGTQPDLFDFAPIDKPYEDGKVAGLEGRDAVPPEKYGVQGANYEGWMKGYYEGNTLRAQAHDRAMNPGQPETIAANQDGDDLTDLPESRDPDEEEEAGDDQNEDDESSSTNQPRAFTEAVAASDKVARKH